jgi:hypothetical protein
MEAIWIALPTAQGRVDLNHVAECHPSRDVAELESVVHVPTCTRGRSEFDAVTKITMMGGQMMVITLMSAHPLDPMTTSEGSQSMIEAPKLAFCISHLKRWLSRFIYVRCMGNH